MLFTHKGELPALNTNLATTNVLPQDHALFQSKKPKVDPEQQYKPYVKSVQSHCTRLIKL